MVARQLYTGDVVRVDRQWSKPNPYYPRVSDIRSALSTTEVKRSVKPAERSGLRRERYRLLARRYFHWSFFLWFFAGFIVLLSPKFALPVAILGVASLFLGIYWANAMNPFVNPRHLIVGFVVAIGFVIESAVLILLV